MAAVAKSGAPSLATTIPCPAHHYPDLVANEDIAAGDACYILSTGKVARSTGAAANAAAKVDGYAPIAVKSGRSMSLYFDVDYHYGAGLTPGSRLYLSGTTAGGLDTVASTGGTAPIAVVLSATLVRVMQSRY